MITDLMKSNKFKIVVFIIAALLLFGSVYINGKNCTSYSCLNSSATHLIIVPGHATFIGSDYRDYLNESNWFLESYQKGQLSTFIEHIKKACQVGSQDARSLIIFSGGQTRIASNSRSEGYSYYLVATEWLKSESTVEMFARDSLENVEFSLARFKEYTGREASKITIVGFEFKRARFVDLHRAALGISLNSFNYIGIDGKIDLEDAKRGEERTFNLFKQDLFGCKGELREKKMSRNPFNLVHGYKGIKSC